MLADGAVDQFLDLLLAHARKVGTPQLGSRIPCNGM
jgi:hypothetical protein